MSNNNSLIILQKLVVQSTTPTSYYIDFGNGEHVKFAKYKISFSEMDKKCTKIMFMILVFAKFLQVF